MADREIEMQAFLEDRLTKLQRQSFRHFTHVSLKYKYLFVSTPKVACSSILLTLHRAEYEDETFVPEPWDAIHARHYSPLLYPDQINRFTERLRSDDLFAFCFVRNPYSRIASCYIDKVINTEYMSQRLLGALGRAGADVSFEDFLEFIAEEPAALHDEHYALQVDHLFTGLIPYDFVGRFEQLADDMRFVAKRTGLDLDRFQGRLDSHRTDGQVGPHLFTDRSRELIQRIYERDFTAFGYAM